MRYEIMEVAKAIAAAWQTENKSADPEQSAILFESSARAAIEKLHDLFLSQPLGASEFFMDIQE